MEAEGEEEQEAVIDSLAVASGWGAGGGFDEAAGNIAGWDGLPPQDLEAFWNQAAWTDDPSWASAEPAPFRSGGGAWGPGAACGANLRPKRRFCTYYPDVSLCRRGDSCAFAHSREELTSPLLDVEEENQNPEALTDNFFMYKYKTRWCPIGVQHEWHSCVYAHNYQDARRPPAIGYGARVCPYWSKKDTGAEYYQRCPLGLRCAYSHGAKEQLYHPQYFKTVVCRDLKGKVCPRQTLCAFFHVRGERRPTSGDNVDYSQPLPKASLPEEWVQDFLQPPFVPGQPEGSRPWEDGGLQGPGASDDGYYGGGKGFGKMCYGGQRSMQQMGYGGQGDWSNQMPGPCVILLPVGGMNQGSSGDMAESQAQPYMVPGFPDWYPGSGFFMPTEGNANLDGFG